MRLAGLGLAFLLLAPALQSRAQTEYVRDEIRIKLRDGPSDRFQLVRVLVSGAPVPRLVIRFCLAGATFWCSTSTRCRRSAAPTLRYFSRSP